MPEIIFQRIKSTATGVDASTGKQTEVAFNENFALVKNLLDQLFAIASVTVTSEQITQLKVDTTTNPYTLYYTTDTEEPITWRQLVSVSFASITGSPNDNIALKNILDSKGSASDVSTLQTQMTAAQSNISNLQNTVSQHTTDIGANSVAIGQLNTAVANRVRVPSGDILYLRYVQQTNSVEYSTDGTTWISILSSGVTFASITGNASDNASLVSYVANTISNALAGYITTAMFNSHTTNYSNPHNVTKAQVGLGDVENYSMSTMPIPDSVQQALNSITANTPPIYNISPAEYRTITPGVNSVYFTSNAFASNNN